MRNFKSKLDDIIDNKSSIDISSIRDIYSMNAQLNSLSKRLEENILVYDNRYIRQRTKYLNDNLTFKDDGNRIKVYLNKKIIFIVSTNYRNLFSMDYNSRMYRAQDCSSDNFTGRTHLNKSINEVTDAVNIQKNYLKKIDGYFGKFRGCLNKEIHVLVDRMKDATRRHISRMEFELCDLNFMLNNCCNNAKNEDKDDE